MRRKEVRLACLKLRGVILREKLAWKVVAAFILAVFGIRLLTSSGIRGNFGQLSLEKQRNLEGVPESQCALLLYALNGKSPLRMRLMDLGNGFEEEFQLVYNSSPLESRKGNSSCEFFDLVYVDSEFQADAKKIREDLQGRRREVSLISGLTDSSMLFRYWKGFWNRAKYCQRMGYRCIFRLCDLRQLPGQYSHFCKVRAMRKALTISPFAMWMDIDAFFSDQAMKRRVPIEKYILKESYDFASNLEMIFGMWSKPFLNSGLMIVRNTSQCIKLLKDWEEFAHSNHDQPALWHTLYKNTYELYLQGKLTLANEAIVYNGELLKECSNASYTHCRAINYRMWRRFYGQRLATPGKYPLFYIHSNIYDKINDREIMHCVMCHEADRSFVVHMGSSSWGRHSLIQQNIEV